MTAMEQLIREGTSPAVPEEMYGGQMPLIHKLLFGMLCDVDSICRRHGIKYFLGGGTLLGAVREHGFIPWDDDVDIMMLREDYEKFLEAARHDLPEHLFLQTSADEKGCHYLNAKIRLRGTVMCSEFLARFPELEKGVFLDIFAHDHTAGSKTGQKIHQKLTLLARGLVFKKWSGDSACRVTGKKRYFIFDIIKTVLPFSVLEWFQKKMLTLYDKRKTDNLYDGMGVNIGKGAFPVKWLSEVTEAEFEGRSFPVPLYYKEYLSFLYGDYMKPEVRETAYHEAAFLDLGIYAEHTEDRVKI